MWPCYRLWLEGKADITTMDGYFDPARPETFTKLSIDDVDLRCVALDEWHAAERRMMKRRK